MSFVRRGEPDMTLGGYYFNQFTTMQYVDFCVRLLVAFLIGGAVGLERSNRFKEAGIRTHIIVCVTSTLIMLISKYGFADMDFGPGMDFFGSKGADAARVAAQAVSGISFLCAGVIIKVGSNIKGLTTAAGIWMTAGIGLAIGAGMYVVVGFTVVLLWILQYVVYKMRIGAESYDGYHLKFSVSDSDSFERELSDQLEKWGAQVTESNITWQQDGFTDFDFVIRRANPIEYRDIKEFVTKHPEISSFSYIPLSAPHLL